MYENRITLTVNEASQYTGIGRNSLRELISWNVFPTIKIGKKTLIRVEILNEFLILNEGKDIKNKQELIAL